MTVYFEGEKDAGKGRFLLKRNFPGSVLTMIVSYLLRMLKIA